MATWHKTNCRQPEVLLVDNAPICLSCDSIFSSNDYEVDKQLNKQTPLVDKLPTRLNLDWPSSITFSTLDDVTDPNLKTILLNLDRHDEASQLEAEQNTGHERPSSVHAALRKGDFMTETEVTPITKPVSSQHEEASLTSHETRDDYGTRKFSKTSDLDVGSGEARLESTSQNDVYSSLTSTDEIRLLHLDPLANDSEPLHGYLKPARLSQRPEYTALSYTWADSKGDRTLRDKIFLGKAWTPFAITSNCAAALRRLRLRGSTRLLWVDAICIDQSNIGERSHQVSMMRDIYSRAESVAIYLGGDTGDETDTPAGRLMQRLSDDRFHAGRPVQEGWGGDFDYQGASDLFRQPYWSRIWVIQEAVLARKGEIILGGMTVPLDEFIWLFMNKLPWTIKSLLPRWLFNRGGARFGDVNAFYSLLDRTSGCKASDERDMVFALFGLVEGANLEGLVADYSKTMAEIHTGLAAYFLIRHGQSRVLKAAAFAASIAAELASAAERGTTLSSVSNGIFFRPITPEPELEDGNEKCRDYHTWRATLPSWVPLGMFDDERPYTSRERPITGRLMGGRNSFIHETMFSRHEYLRSPRLRDWYPIFVQMRRRRTPTPSECDRLWQSQIWPRSCEQPQMPLTTCKVFGSHGTLLIRAYAVVHMSSLASSLQNGYLDPTIFNIYGCNTCILTSPGTAMKWGLCVNTSAFPSTDDDWIIEVPGCDAFLHLIPSGRVPGTYKIASLSTVFLVGDNTYHTSNTSMLPFEYGRYGGAENAAADYRFWMPLVSLDVHLLLFLQYWESIAPVGSSLAPSRSTQEDSPSHISPEELEEYGRWLELITTPQPGGYRGLNQEEFDPVVKKVSMYLERWEDGDLWSRIQQIVVQVPWQEKLQELADIKADVRLYLAMRNHLQASNHAITWKHRLLPLFNDLVRQLPAIPPQPTKVGLSLWSLMSMDTYSSLCESIEKIPDYWNNEELRTNENRVFQDWEKLESWWKFMERSKADCRALQGKFVQLRALKRLCRREQQDFLIC
jgi:hypothetical protein